MIFVSNRRMPVVILVDPVSGEEHIWAANTGDELEVKALKLYYEGSEDITGIAHVETTQGVKPMYIRVVPEFDERVVAPKRYYELRERITS